MKRWHVLVTGLALLALYGLVGSADLQDSQDDRARYCDMIDLWAETGSDAGWPPYNGNCED